MNNEELEKIIQEQTVTIKLMQATIQNLINKINVLQGDMDYLHESTSPKLIKAVSELQEEVAKEKNVPVSTFTWRVWDGI